MRRSTKCENDGVGDVIHLQIGVVFVHLLAFFFCQTVRHPPVGSHEARAQILLGDILIKNNEMVKKIIFSLTVTLILVPMSRNSRRSPSVITLSACFIPE